MANRESKSKLLEEESRKIIKYRECRRNHAILIGGHAVDGCGEFSPKGDQGTKEAFFCEACGCHRNFHRKELIKNGTVVLDTHRSYGLYSTAAMWVEYQKKGFVFHHPLSSFSLIPSSPAAPYYQDNNVSDQESLVYNGSKTTDQKKMKERGSYKRHTLMHNKK